MEYEKLRILIKDVLDREDPQESVGNSYLADVLATEILNKDFLTGLLLLVTTCGKEEGKIK